MRIHNLKPLALIVLIFLSACRAKTGEPVTFNGWDKFDVPTLDPQMAGDVSSVDVVENLFVQLTNFDLGTADIIPEAATRWQISADGLVYSFTIRTDIPWVRYDPATGETSQEQDPQGKPRFLSAHDFVFAIKRACDPNTGSYYSTVVAPLIKGCSSVLFTPDPKNIPAPLWDAISVSAPDDATLIIELEFPASYFLSMTPLWTLSAVPQWVVKAHGKDWTQPDHIVTNGRFVLEEWVPDVRRSFARNPLLPEDLRGDGNIQRLVITLVPDYDAGYALWLKGKVDTSHIPEDKRETHLEQFPAQTHQTSDLAVYYISFRMSKPPFDDPRVRRAFSAAFDRDTYVNEVLLGQGLPMIHFAPPGIFGAPPIDEVGLGFDPDFARQQLADAGFPDCQGFPHVTLVDFREHSSFRDYVQAQWADNLGCGADVLHVEHRPFAELMMLTEDDIPDARAPHMWIMGWAPDYADENNWVGDVLWCKGANRQKRRCNEIDDLIVQAREETRPESRIELYWQIEEMLFGTQGETPIAPILMRTAPTARHTWLDLVSAPFGGEQWYHWTLDQEAQQAAQH